MATANNITTTYIGKDSKAFITPVVQSGLTLATPGVRIHSNVNYKSRITSLDVANIIKDATCDFDATGTVNQAEVWLEVKKLEVNLQLCKNDYYKDFVGENAGAWGGLNNGAFLRFLLSVIGGSVADSMESMIWTGVDGAGQFNGFETLFGAPDITATPTTATVIADLRAMTAVANAKLLGKSDLRYYVGSAIFQMIREANNDKNASNPCGENCVAVDGIQIFHAPGMAVTSMALAQIGNLHYGTWMSNDQNRIAVIDQEPLDGSDNFNFVMKWFGGAQIGYRNEIVYSSEA